MAARVSCEPVDLQPDPGEHRQRVVAAGRHRDLAHRLGQPVGRDGAGQLRHRGQLRVVLDRHGRQAEPAAAAGDRRPRAVDDQVHRLGRQRTGDVGQQPAGHQHPTGIADGRVELDPGRGLVVEPGHRPAGHRPARRTASISTPPSTGTEGRRRQAARDPGGGIGQDVAFDPELHGRDLSRWAGIGGRRPLGRPADPAGIRSGAHRRALTPASVIPTCAVPAVRPESAPIHGAVVLVLR